jgi:hypothetical protein
MSYADFKQKYEDDAVADIISKEAGAEKKEPVAETIDISKGAADLMQRHEDDANFCYHRPVTDVIYGKPVFADKPARLAYEATDKSMSYANFKQKYEEDAIADIISKEAGAEKKEPVTETTDISKRAADLMQSHEDDANFCYHHAVTDVIRGKPVFADEPKVERVGISVPYDVIQDLYVEVIDTL